MKKSLLSLLLVAAATLSGTQLQAQVISDTELKINRSPINTASAYISSLEPVQFEYNTQKFSQFKLPEGRQLGFVNDDPSKDQTGLIKDQKKVYTSGKNAVRTATLSTVDIESLIPVMVAALQEQQREIEALKKELAAVKKSGR